MFPNTLVCLDLLAMVLPKQTFYVSYLLPNAPYRADSSCYHMFTKDFVPGTPFPYPLKTSENNKVF